METKIRKWGNSLGVRLPKHIAQNQSLSDGVSVLITEKDGKILIEAISKTEPTLKELVSGITEENRHPEVDWGKARGNEAW